MDPNTELNAERERNVKLAETAVTMSRVATVGADRILQLTVQVMYLIEVLDRRGIVVDLDEMERQTGTRLGEYVDIDDVLKEPPRRQRPDLRVVN